MMPGALRGGEENFAGEGGGSEFLEEVPFRKMGEAHLMDSNPQVLRRWGGKPEKLEGGRKGNGPRGGRYSAGA